MPYFYRLFNYCDSSQIAMFICCKRILFGKNVSAFTNAEETAAGLMDVAPFHLESAMRELGGVFESGPPWGAYAVREGNLVTGQDPASSALLAQHLVAALQGKQACKTLHFL
jgi:putative intracellular protease/amidase